MMMNIDRPLEEIILEKRKERRTQARKQRRPRKSSTGAAETSKDVDGDVKMADAVTKKKATKTIKKKRRTVGGGTKVKLAKSKEVQAANGILDQAMKSFQTQSGGKGTPTPTTGGAGTKVTVTNLDPGVTNIDVSELFGAVGPLKRALVLYDKNGRSTGIAEVVFENNNDALEAIKKYNGVPLDNRPLQISLATTEKVRKGKDSSGSGSGFWNGNAGSFDGGEQNPFNKPLAQGASDQENQRTSRRGRSRRRYYGGRNRNNRDDLMMQE